MKCVIFNQADIWANSISRKTGKGTKTFLRQNSSFIISLMAYGFVDTLSYEIEQLKLIIKLVPEVQRNNFPEDILRCGHVFFLRIQN